jgi:NACalpha-BTF3-like transcription factor
MRLAEAIKLLRAKVPVGVKGAKDLLNENNGDIIKTETAFKNRMIDLMSRQCLLSAERAEKYLKAANYDLGLAYRGYELDRYSLTQLAEFP